MSPEIKAASKTIEALGFEVRFIPAGSDGVRLWAIHRPDPTTGTGYNERSYFNADELIALSQSSTKQQMVLMIRNAHHRSTNHYLLLKEDKSMSKNKTVNVNKTTAATEKSKRDAKAAKSNGNRKATAAKKPASKATSKKAAATTKATKNAAAPMVVESNDPDVQLLAKYQPNTIERMSANAVVSLYKKIKAATPDKPVLNSELSLYPKRIARELARLGLVGKERVPKVGVVYFAAA